MDALMNFSETHINEDCKSLSGVKDKALFYKCVFDKLNGLTLKDCDLNRSRFVTQEIKDARGFTLTLDCHSFNKVEYSPLLFDLLLCLMTTTTGNIEKRRKLQEIVGTERWTEIMTALKGLD